MAVALQKNKTLIQSFEAEKNKLAIKLLSIKDQSVLQALKFFLDELTAKHKRMSSAQYNKEINCAVERVRTGKSVSHNEVMNEMENW